MKKFLATIFLIIGVALFAGIATASPAFALEQTQNIAVYKASSGEYIAEWTQVPDNCGYAFYFAGTRSVTGKDENFIVLNESLLAAGENELSVAAIDSAGAEGEKRTFVYEHYVPFAVPDELTFSEESKILSWTDDNENATYDVVINRVLVASDLPQKQVDLSEFVVNVGIYEIKVVANGAGYRLTSKFSNSLVYTEKKALSSPKNLSFLRSEGKVTATWSQVENAERYLVAIKKDGIEIGSFSASGTTADISEYVSEVAEYEVSVVADAGEESFYLASEKITSSYKTSGVLASPVLTIDGNVVSWSAVENAKVYSVAVDDVPADEEITKTSFDFSALVKEVGAHKISVQAEENGLYAASDISVVYCYTYGKLAAPSVTLDGSVLGWEAVEHAKDYAVLLDGKMLDAHVAGTTFDLSDYVAAAGNYIVSVRANETGFYRESDLSRIEYTLAVSLGKTEAEFDEKTLTLSWNAVVGAVTYVVSIDDYVVGETSELSYTFSEQSFAAAGIYVLSVYAKGYDNFLGGDKATVNFEKQDTFSATRLILEGADASIERLIQKGYVAYVLSNSDMTAKVLGENVISPDGVILVDLSEYKGLSLGIVEKSLDTDEEFVFYDLSVVSDGDITMTCTKYSVPDVTFEYNENLAEGIALAGNTPVSVAAGGYVACVIGGVSAQDYMSYALK